MKKFLLFIILGAFTQQLSALEIDVRAHGAIPNDGTDDTKNIQKAINVAYKKRGNNLGTVVLCGGRYLVNPSSSLVLKGGVRLVGCGQSGVELYSSSDSPGSIITSPNQGLHKKQEIAHLRIVLTGNGQTAIDASLMGEAKIYNNNITTLPLRSKPKEFDREAAKPYYSNTRGILLSSHNALVDDSIQGNGVHVYKNSISYMTIGVLVQRSSRQRIEGNQIKSCNTGIYAEHNSSALFIMNNDISNWASGQYGIDLVASGGLVSGNYLGNRTKGAQGGILLEKGSSLLKVNNNLFYLYAPNSTVGVVNKGSRNEVKL